MEISSNSDGELFFEDTDFCQARPAGQEEAQANLLISELFSRDAGFTRALEFFNDVMCRNNAIDIEVAKSKLISSLKILEEAVQKYDECPFALRNESSSLAFNVNVETARCKVDAAISACAEQPPRKAVSAAQARLTDPRNENDRKNTMPLWWWETERSKLSDPALFDSSKLSGQSTSNAATTELISEAAMPGNELSELTRVMQEAGVNLDMEI